MSVIKLEAETRVDKGKGASRRLRRLENKVPAIVYGGEEAPKLIHLLHNKVVKALETEAIFSSVFELSIDGKAEQVILKDLQRHPYKPIIMHMDLQRVHAKDILVKMVPIHFLNEEECKGIKAGGIANHSMNQVEVRCQAKHLPEYIEVDMSEMALDDVIHLSDLKLPKGVHLTTIPEGDHDHPVVSIHKPKRVVESEVSAEEEPTSDSSLTEDNAD